MFGLGVSEIVIIAIAAAILLFGSKKVVELARSLGRVGGEFKKGQRDIEAELSTKDEPEKLSETTPPASTTAEPTAANQTNSKSS